MELWPLFGGRSEFLKAPKAVVQRCRYILRGKHEAEQELQRRQEADIAKARQA